MKDARKKVCTLHTSLFVSFLPLLVITTTTTAMTHLLRSIFSLENSNYYEDTRSHELNAETVAKDVLASNADVAKRIDRMVEDGERKKSYVKDMLVAVGNETAVEL